MTKPLTERVKADREEMARQVKMLAEGLGATVTRKNDNEGEKSRAIDLYIATPRGLNVSVGFDGAHANSDTYVLSWHLSTETPELLTDAFGDVNPYHFSKATDVAHGFADLVQKIQKSLGMAADGSAFRPPEEVKAIKIANNARYEAMVANSRKMRPTGPGQH